MHSPFSLLLLEVQRWLGACRELSGGLVRAGWPRLGSDMAGKQVVQSTFSQTSFGITILGTSAQAWGKLQQHSVLQLTSVSTSTSSWIVFRTAGSLGLPWQHCQRSRAICFSWLGLNETSGATFWEGICSFKGSYIVAVPGWTGASPFSHCAFCLRSTSEARLTCSWRVSVWRHRLIRHKYMQWLNNTILQEESNSLSW